MCPTVLWTDLWPTAVAAHHHLNKLDRRAVVARLHLPAAAPEQRRELLSWGQQPEKQVRNGLLLILLIVLFWTLWGNSDIKRGPVAQLLRLCAVEKV